MRALPPLPASDPLDQLSPTHAEQERWLTDPGNPLWDDPPAHELRAEDLEPDDSEPADGHDTTWTWDLDDLYAWLPEAVSR